MSDTVAPSSSSCIATYVVFFTGEADATEADATESDEGEAELVWKLSCIFLPTMKILDNTIGTVKTTIMFFVKLYTKYPTNRKKAIALKLPVIK